LQLKVNKIIQQTKEMDAISTEKPLLAQLRELEVGQELTVPISRRSSLKTMVSTFGPEWDRKYKTESKTAARTFTVRRTR